MIKDNQKNFSRLHVVIDACVITLSYMFAWALRFIAVSYTHLLIYSDEDIIDIRGNRLFPHFKPDFNPDYLCCVNYICHLVVVKRTLLDRAGLLRPEYDGSQDFDFLLRCTEHTDSEKIRHIPKILYHWRSHEGSTAGNPDDKPYAVIAGEKALAGHYERMGIKAEDVYKRQVHGFFVLLAIILFICNGRFPDWYYLQILYYSACVFFLVLGLCYATSAIAVLFRDLNQIIGIGLQVGVWLTPIMWVSESMIGANSLLYKILQLNPVFYIVSGYRDAFIIDVYKRQ